jgi:predicted SpoU family rRNA methylase
MSLDKTEISEYYKGTIYDANLTTAIEWSMKNFGGFEMLLFHNEETTVVDFPFEVIHSRGGKFTIVSQN